MVGSGGYGEEGCAWIGSEQLFANVLREQPRPLVKQKNKALCKSFLVLYLRSWGRVEFENCEPLELGTFMEVDVFG